MSKQTLEGFIVYRKWKWEPEGHFVWQQYEPSIGDAEDVLVRPQSIEIEVPDDFDPRPQQVAALEAEKQKLRADFAKRVTEIDTEISKLLCLEAA